MKEIYLDNSATTKVDKNVLKAIFPYFKEKYHNPSSDYEKSRTIKKDLEEARKIIAQSIGAKSNEIIFTSGGTEANNLALKGLFFSHYLEKNHIITTKIEHDSILESCRWLEKQGAKVTYLDVDKEGFIDTEELKKNINEKTFLVSVIHANNEIGTIQNLEKIGEICRNKKVLFHTDACQSFTKTHIDVKKQNIDLMAINSHKIHGPKGVGALYLKEDISITPLFHGGGHESGLRSGTENIAGAIGFAKAVSISNHNDIKKMKKLRNYLIEEILKIENVSLNGTREERLCNNVNVLLKGVEGETLVAYLEERGIYISTGSACSSITEKTSHVLKAIGLKANEARSSLRITISKFTKKQEIKIFLKILKDTILMLKIKN